MAKSTIKEVTGITKAELSDLIDHWEKFAKCYFWSSPGSASSRRNEESRHFRHVFFKVDGVDVEVMIEVTCSCKNYYCKRSVYAPEHKAQGLRYLKKVYEAM